MDNLEAQTYETFERDAMKYIQVWEQWIHDILHIKYLFYEYVSFLFLLNSTYETVVVGSCG